MRISIKGNIRTKEDLRKSYNKIYSEKPSYLKESDKFYRWIIDLLEPEKDKKLLDIACGGGYLLREAEKRGLKTYGIDISDKAIEIAKINAPDSHLKVSDAEKTPFLDNYFDYITNLGSLEHFLHPEQGVREMSRILNDEGKALVLVPNSHSFIYFTRVLRTGGIYRNAVQEIEQDGTKNEWQKLLEGNGLSVIKVLKYNSPPSQMKSSKYYLVYCFIYPFIPLNLSYCFVFICRKKSH